jgi:hypothetical protein
MRREKELWAALEHQNIVPLYGYAEDEGVFGLFGALISPVRYQSFNTDHLILQQWYVNGDAGQFLEAHGEEMDIVARSTLVRDFRLISLPIFIGDLVDGHYCRRALYPHLFTYNCAWRSQARK